VWAGGVSYTSPVATDHGQSIFQPTLEQQGTAAVTLVFLLGVPITGVNLLFFILFLFCFTKLLQWHLPALLARRAMSRPS
jgi:hypothetical protein